jgi:hypothetical protein
MDLIAILLLLIAAQSNTPEAPQNERCSEPKGWEQINARDPRFVVFGELHGTQQSPDFIANLACGLSSQGQKILVAVELSAAEDSKLQEAWKLPADRFDDALLESGWRGRTDGVASAAMFSMIVRLHNLKEQGSPISIVAFNGTKDRKKSVRFSDLPGQGPHEAEQAANIAEAANTSEYDRVLVLVGNFHARTGSVALPGVQFDPMAKRLAQYGSTVSLNMRYAEGTSWNCVLKAPKEQNDKPVTADSLDCGIHHTRGSKDIGSEPFIELTPSPGTEQNADYDGYFWVGPISGSPPVAGK